MTEFVVHSRSGEPAVKTTNPAEAARFQAILGGHISSTDSAPKEQS